MRIVSLQEEEHKIHLPPIARKSEKKFNNVSLINNLVKMKKSIINHKELQCEVGSLRQRKTNPLQELLDSKVNQRTSKCTSYRNSLFKVLYPKGINPRKK